MKTIINIVCALIIIFVYGIPFLIVGINRLKDKYDDRTTAIIEICMGAMFIIWPFFMQAIMGWEI